MGVLIIRMRHHCGYMGDVVATHTLRAHRAQSLALLCCLSGTIVPQKEKRLRKEDRERKRGQTLRDSFSLGLTNFHLTSFHTTYNVKYLNT